AVPISLLQGRSMNSATFGLVLFRSGSRSKRLASSPRRGRSPQYDGAGQRSGFGAKTGDHVAARALILLDLEQTAGTRILQQFVEVPIPMVVLGEVGALALDGLFDHG